MSLHPTSQNGAVTRELAARYRTASKKSKGAMLDELCSVTGWSRDHARRAVRTMSSPRGRRRRQGGETKSPTYDDDVQEPLRKIWTTLDAPCDKRLAPFMTEIVSVLEREAELSLAPAQRSKLLKISAATIDRRLAQQRRRLTLTSRGKIRQETPLKHQIPIRSSSDWSETHPGVFNCTLVSHDGGDGQGDSYHSLVLTDAATGWTDVRLLRNKSRGGTFEALNDVEASLPFELTRLLSNNGAEFMNDHLLHYCAERGIPFTRALPPRKSPSFFVEQKSSATSRRSIGCRYDSEDELVVLSDLYQHLRPYVNFFEPRMKLLQKSRRGDKVHKRYETARTPYQRLLSVDISEEAKKALTDQYLVLNPVELKRSITRCQLELSLTHLKTKNTKFGPREGCLSDSHLNAG